MNKLNERLLVLLGVTSICGLSAYQVYSRPAKKAGHDFASNEKPQALRGETERNLQEEKAKFEAHERMLQMAATNGTAPNAELK